MSRHHDFSAGSALERAAAAWVFRRDIGLNVEEEAEYQRWLEADPCHRAAVLRHTQAWSEFDRPRQTGQVDEVVRRLATRAEQRRHRVGAAGIAFGLILSAGLLWHSRSPEPVEPMSTRTAVVMPERQTLADGSVVELKTGAEIAVDFSGALRRVVLKSGEAHFQVVKSERPFVVAAGKVEFRAVGTAFAVQIAKAEVHLLVTEGQVAVEKPAVHADAAGRDPKLLPQPSEILATVGPRNRMVVGLDLAAPVLPPTVIPSIELAERLAWRAPRLEFTETPLAEAVKLMNTYNRQQFVIVDSEVGKILLNGLFRADQTESFAQLLETNFGVEAEISDDVVKLRRKR